MPNEHVTAYLNEYISKPGEPGFAILIAGAWGSGKTFLVKEYFKAQAASRHLYVSIHGVSNEVELRARFVFAAYPLLKNKKVRAFSSIARSAVGAFGIDTNLTLDDLLEYDQYDVLVVDDLERAMIPLETAFGFLNQLVEQEGRKLVLIGSEYALRGESPKFKEIKEKTVGFTLTVEPDVESLLARMHESVAAPLQGIILEHRLEIAQVFRLSGTDNLRVLSQALEDYLPIAVALESDGRVPKSSKIEMLKLFLAVSIAYKVGKIDRDDIVSRQNDHFAGLFGQSDTDINAGPLGELDSRFPDIDIFSNILDNEYLEKRVCDGLHREDLIARSIGDARAQSDPESNPEWRNVWYYMRNDDEVTSSSYLKMIEAFFRRDYKDAGTILHIFGILLEARLIGLSEWSDAKVLREGKAYLDDLVANDELPPLGEDFLTGFRHGAAHGLGFMNAKSPVFSKLWTYYKSRSNEARRNKMVERISGAAELLGRDYTSFSNMISSSDAADNVYSVPILHLLNPGDLAERFMSCDAPAQFQIMLALGSRYTRNPYPAVLEGERRWLRAFRRAVISKLRGLDKLAKTRIKRLLEWNVDEFTEAPLSDAADQQGVEVTEGA